MDKPDKPPKPQTAGLDSAALKARLRRAAQDLFPERTIDELELEHLMRVVTECSILFKDVYSEERIRRIMRPNRRLIRDLVDQLIESRLHADPDSARVRRLPEEVRLVGDKALYRLGGAVVGQLQCLVRWRAV